MISRAAEPPPYLTVLALVIAVAPVAIALILVRRRRVARLNAAAVLVYWGLFIVALEHANWGLAEFGGSDLQTHTGFHYQMLAVYGLAGLVLVGVVVAPLIRRGNEAGWVGLLVILVIGVGAEVATAIVTIPHGVPPRYWIVGLGLWVYPVAWAVALILSFRPIFRHGSEDGGADGVGLDVDWAARSEPTFED